MKTNYPLNIRNEDQLKAVLGVTPQLYARLVDAFDECIKAELQARREAWMNSETAKRKPNAKLRSKLPSADLQVAFVLYYLKNYTLLQTFADRFDMCIGAASGHLKVLIPRLVEVLQEWEVLPQRSFESAEQMQAYMEQHNWEEVLIDATERRHCRPKNDSEQRALYSGKKKCMA